MGVFEPRLWLAFLPFFFGRRGGEGVKYVLFGFMSSRQGHRGFMLKKQLQTQTRYQCWFVCTRGIVLKRNAEYCVSTQSASFTTPSLLVSNQRCSPSIDLRSLTHSLTHSLTRALMTVDVRVTIENVTNRGSPHASDREQASFDPHTQVGGVGGIAIVFRRGSVEGQRGDMDGPIVRLVHERPRFHLRLVSGGQLPTVAAEGAGQRRTKPSTWSAANRN